MHRIARFTIVVTASLGCARASSSSATPSAERVVNPQKPTVIHAFDRGVEGASSKSTSVTLRVVNESAINGPVLHVTYPAKSGDPAARDVRLEATARDWSKGQAIAFQVRAAHPMRMSVSFIDRNGVLYTSWVDVRGESWQSVHLAFGDLKPNPYFQPPTAKKGSALDVSEVSFIAFAPQEESGGELSITRIELVR